MSGHTLVNQLALGVSTGGNTAGNTGTTQVPLAFAGVSGITLSQGTGASQATISIVGPGASLLNAVGVSTGGNTSGNTATTYGTMVVAAMGGVTANQSTAAGSLATISISGPAIATTVNSVSAANAVGTVNRYALEDHAHAGVQVAGVSTQGNTAGSTGLFPGSLQIAALGVATASQSSNASGVTVSISVPAAAASGTVVSGIGVSTGGNTAGSTGTTLGTVVLAGMGGITASQSTAVGSLATISFSGPAVATTVSSVSAANAVGTVNRYAREDHAHAGVQVAGVSTDGNTAGSTGLFPGSFQIVASGNIISASQSSNASGVTVTLNANTFAGADVVTALGVSTGGNTAGNTGLRLGTVVLQATGGVTLSQATAVGNSATIQISVAAGGGTKASIWQPYLPTDSIQATSSSLSVMPLFFPMSMSATQMDIAHSLSPHSANDVSLTYSVGLYTLSGSTASLASSGSGSLGTANPNSSNISGQRAFSIPLGTWNVSPTEALLGFVWSAKQSDTKGGTSAAGGISITGFGHTFNSFSGYTGGNVNITSHWGGGIFSVGTLGLPASIHITDINRTFAARQVMSNFLLAGTV